MRPHEVGGDEDEEEADGDQKKAFAEAHHAGLRFDHTGEEAIRFDGARAEARIVRQAGADERRGDAPERLRGVRPAGLHRIEFAGVGRCLALEID